MLLNETARRSYNHAITVGVKTPKCRANVFRDKRRPTDVLQTKTLRSESSSVQFIWDDAMRCPFFAYNYTRWITFLSEIMIPMT